MLVEFERFIEFGEGYFKDGSKCRGNLVFDRMTINTDYIGWFRRCDLGNGFEFCEVHMVDRGGTVIVTKTYEEMRELLNMAPKEPRMTTKRRFGFKSRTQLPFFMVWDEFLHDGEVFHATVRFNSMDWIGF